MKFFNKAALAVLTLNLLVVPVTQGGISGVSFANKRKEEQEQCRTVDSVKSQDSFVTDSDEEEGLFIRFLSRTLLRHHTKISATLLIGWIGWQLRKYSQHTPSS